MTSRLEIHFIYLHCDVAGSPSHKQLLPMLHPGCLAGTGQALVVGSELDVSMGPYLSVKAMDWETMKAHRILLPHGLVASMLVARSHSSPPGFVDLETIREQLQAD